MSDSEPCCTKEKMIHWCYICETKCCPTSFPEGSIRIERHGWTYICLECAAEIRYELNRHNARRLEAKIAKMEEDDPGLKDLV